MQNLGEFFSTIRLYAQKIKINKKHTALPPVTVS